MIGDRITDQVAGQLAGVRKSYLFKTEAAENEIKELCVWEGRRANLIREIRGWLSTELRMQIHTPHLDRAAVTPFYTHLIENFAEVELA